MGTAEPSALTILTGLIGRDQECRRIDALLETARQQRSGSLVLSGEAGIGKSSLCAWAIGRAQDMKTLTVHGIETEADLPFAGLSDLFRGELERIGELPRPQAEALEAALARRETTHGDRFAIGAAVLSLLGLVNDGRPVLVVVDDAQWLDASSADALLFAVRRLHDEPLGVLLATRPGGVFDVDRPGLERLTLTGLDAQAARQLLVTIHGPLSDAVCDLLVDRTHGNPLALREVPQLLSDGQLAGKQAIEEPLPVGEELVTALLHGLSGVSDEVRTGLLVAAASDDERVQPVVDALAVMGHSRAVLDAAERAGAIALTGERCEFRHPLLRAAVYHDAPGAARRAAHRALAAVLTGEPQAWQLALATVGEDETVAAALERVAVDARRRGAPAAAAAAFERAARLSPARDARVRRLIEAARDAHVAGRAAQALPLLDDALREAGDALARADIQHVRGRVLAFAGEPEVACRLLVGEAERIRELDAERAAVMLADACMNLALTGHVAEVEIVARRATELAVDAEPGVQAFSGMMLAVALTMQGRRSEAEALLHRFLPLLRLTDPLSEAGQLMSGAAQTYFWLERSDIAAELLGRLMRTARAASAPAALLLPLGCRAELDLRMGRWSVAAAQLDEVTRLGDDMAETPFGAYAPECLAWLAAATGDEQRCRQHADRAMTLITRHGNGFGKLYVHAALGLLELGLGNAEAAVEALERARAVAARHGIGEPNVVHWQGDLIEGYVRAGDLETAEDRLQTLERQATRTGGAWARGTAARCRGLLAEADEADAYFATGIEQLTAAVAPFDLARTHLCHGERLRRDGRRVQAREALRAAIDGFDELGAKPWIARARAELRATGATPRRRRDESARDALTAHELQVARVVAAGASNREAAAALFLSTKTIEFHLARIYRKLGVRTRTQLAALALRRGWLDDAGPDGN